MEWEEGGRGRRPLKEVGEKKKKKKSGKEEVKRTQCCGNKVSGQKTCRHPRTGQVPTGGSSLILDGRLINLFFVSSSQETNAVRVDDFAP